MAVALIGTPANVIFNNGTPDTTFTPGASATQIVAAVSYGNFDGAALTGLSIGGNSFTKKIGALSADNNNAYAEIWSCAGFTGSALTVSVTSASGQKDFGITLYSMSGAATPTVTAKDDTSVHDSATNLSATVACSVGDMVIAAGSWTRQGSPAAWGNSFTTDLDQGSPNAISRLTSAHKVAASTTETATTQGAGGAAGFSVALATVVVPSAGGTPGTASPTGGATAAAAGSVSASGAATKAITGTSTATGKGTVTPTGAGTKAATGIGSATAAGYTLPYVGTCSTVTLTSVNTSAGYLGAYLALSIGDVLAFQTAAYLGATVNYIDVDSGIYTDFDGTQYLTWLKVSNGVATQIALVNGDLASAATPVGAATATGISTAAASGAAIKTATGVAAAAGISATTTTGAARVSPAGIGSAMSVGVAIATAGTAATPVGAGSATAAGSVSATGASLTLVAGTGSALGAGTPVARGAALYPVSGLSIAAGAGTASASAGSLAPVLSSKERTGLIAAEIKIAPLARDDRIGVIAN